MIDSQNKMKLKLIACSVMQHELDHAIKQSPHSIDTEFLSMGLHDKGGVTMRHHLSDVIGRADDKKYDAILLGYALCNNGIAGLYSRSVPLIIPRAHDCITFFLGSKERYAEYFQSHPGTYFQTRGWVQQSHREQPGRLTGTEQPSLKHLIEHYGEDNGRYLFNELQKQYRHYSRYTFISMGIDNDTDIETTVRQKAKERNWEFEYLKGDMSIFTRLVAGKWDTGDFLIVPPGYRIKPTYNEFIIDIEPDDNE